MYLHVVERAFNMRAEELGWDAYALSEPKRVHA